MEKDKRDCACKLDDVLDEALLLLVVYLGLLWVVGKPAPPLAKVLVTSVVFVGIVVVFNRFNDKVTSSMYGAYGFTLVYQLLGGLA